MTTACMGYRPGSVGYDDRQWKARARFHSFSR